MRLAVGGATATVPPDGSEIAVSLTGSAKVTASGTTKAQAEEALRTKACAAGADAVVITKESYGTPFVGTQVSAVFVAFTEREQGKLARSLQVW